MNVSSAWAGRLRAEHPEVVRIGYFGSYATDNYVPGSDFDVLIEVSRAAAGRRADRAEPYRPACFPVGIELFVYTTHELKRGRRDRSAFIREVDRHIVWIA